MKYGYARVSTDEQSVTAWVGETRLNDAFDVVDVHVGRMDRQLVVMSVLSLVGSFCWAEPQPPEMSGAVS